MTRQFVPVVGVVGATEGNDFEKIVSFFLKGRVIVEEVEDRSEREDMHFGRISSRYEG